MDVLLSRVTQQAVHYAIRSGISITTGYAIKECGRLLKQAPKGKEREELMQLQLRLESKIRVIAPSIDMIELIAARGNTSLDSALTLCKDLRYDIQKLGQRLDHAAEEEQQLRQRRTRSREDADTELKAIINQIKLLLSRIEDAVPLINLAITTSGVNLSTKLSGTISPSRLLQASTFLTSADSHFAGQPDIRHQVGPTYVVTLYMLFAGHAARAADQGIRQTTWKEVAHKARVKLWRVPLDQLYCLPGHTEDADERGNSIPAEAKAFEFGYQLAIVEDLDDGRVHTSEDGEPQPTSFDGVEEAGIRDVVPIHEISKIFYADTGKLLNIGADDEPSNPVLLLKRDVHAEPPRRMMRPIQSRPATPDVEPNSEENEQSEIDAQLQREATPGSPSQTLQSDNAASMDTWRLPPDLDPEWMALEVFVEDDSDTEEESQKERPQHKRTSSVDPGLTSAMEHFNIASSPNSTPNPHSSGLARSPGKRAGPPIKTTLSLLEMLMKLAALQQFRQESHLAIEDELLNFFLEDSATAGAGADKDHRQRLRHDAMRRVGFDPYDESPVKRRGEDYIREHGASPRASPLPMAALAYHDDDDDDGGEYSPHQPPLSRLDFARQSIESLSSPPPRLRYSPSPRATVSAYQPTPSRTSTPDDVSDAHRNAVRSKYVGLGGTAKRPSGSPRSQTLVTPPSNASQKTRVGAVRSNSDVHRARSPLHEVLKTEVEETE